MSATVPSELGEKNVRQLLMQYAVPAIIAMTASSLYNMVDSIFIGHIPGVGQYAISGLAVTFPLMNLSTALGTLVGVGASTMLSVLLGQRNYKAAGKVLTNEVLLNIIIGTLFSVFTIAFLDPILTFFGASANTLPYAREYMFIILLGNVFTHLYFGLNNVLRASGHPKMAMGLTIFTVLSNAVLDPVFIYWLGLGIKGAAIATVLCQTLALIYLMRFFLDQKNFLHLPSRLRDFRLDMRVAMDSLTIGMGPFLMNSASCIVTMLINQQLLKYGGDLAIGAYGIVNRFTFLFIMVNMGFNQGMQPIAGYNFGARKFGRVREVYRMTVFCATVVSVAGFIFSEAIPGPAASLFTSDPELKALAVKGLRMMNIALPVIGFQMVSVNLFQCLGMVHKSILLSLSRQLLFLVPLIYFLPSFVGHIGVWLSFPIADSMSVILTATLLFSLLRKLKRLNDGDDPGFLGSKI